MVDIGASCHICIVLKMVPLQTLALVPNVIMIVTKVFNKLVDMDVCYD